MKHNMVYINEFGKFLILECLTDLLFDDEYNS